MKTFKSEKKNSKPVSMANGDRGQRFAVWAKRNGKWIVIGWEDDGGGRSFAHVLSNPEFCDMRIEERKASDRIKGTGCAKCKSQLDAGRLRCSYCNMLFAKYAVGVDLAAAGTSDASIVHCGQCREQLSSVYADHDCSKASKQSLDEAIENAGKS